MTRKEIAIGSMKFAAGATIAGVLGNYYVAPKFGLVVETEATLGDVVTLGLIGFAMSLAFFFVLFSLLARVNRNNED